MGVIIPNPIVATEDGSVSVANVKKIEVTDGDLTDDGARVVTIDTSGGLSSIWAPPTLTLDPTASAQVVEIRAFNAAAGKQLSVMTQDTLGDAYNTLILGKVGDTIGAQFVLDSDKLVTLPGIKFPDDTEQTTAATGGGGGISGVLPLIGSTGADQYNIGTSFPWGNSSTGTQAINPLSKPQAFPFIAPKTGTVTEVGVKVTTADSGKGLYVAIYSSDSNNLPSTRLGYVTISLNATGDIYSSSITGTIALTAGTSYWYSVNADEVMYNGVLRSNTITYMHDIGITDDLDDQVYSIIDTAATAYAIPAASFTANSLNNTITRPYVGLKF